MLLGLGACSKAPAPEAASGLGPSAAAPAAAPRPAAGPDPALPHALACAAAGVAQQPAMLAAAAKLGKTQMVGAMTGSIWAKTAGDLVAARGGSETDAQAAVNTAIGKASADASAGKPDLDEAALEDCVTNAKL